MKFSLVALLTAVTLVAAAPLELNNQAVNSYLAGLEAEKFPSIGDILAKFKGGKSGGGGGGLGGLLGGLKKGKGGGSSSSSSDMDM